MTPCTCCGIARDPSADRYAGTIAWSLTYGQLFTCRSCTSSYLLIQWEQPDSELLVDDQLSVTCSERDAREEEAA